MTSLLAQQIENLLPQTQCTKCGFAGCAPYAEALSVGTAEPNQCPPGGQEGVVRLARLLGKPERPLNPENGVERPRPRAFIDESVCIGCTLCIQACPVDAIVGAAKSLHTVIADDCTGCDLCVAPCPVDCITMVPVTGTATGWQAWTQDQADTARWHYTRRLARQHREQSEAEARVAQRVVSSTASADTASAKVDRSGDRSGDQSADVSVPSEAVSIPSAATSSAASDVQPLPPAPPAVGVPDDAQAKKQAIIQAAIERARLRQLTEPPPKAS